MTIAVKNNFERRIGIWPAGFDKDDIMYCNTSYGDYPHYLPGKETAVYNAPAASGGFCGWMLLNYNKPVAVSSTLGNYAANFAVDENIKTYWSAATGNAGEWILTDLGRVSTVNAIQIDYADQDAEFLGKQIGIYHQYRLFESADGKHWRLLVDKSNNGTDVPQEYVELEHPVQTRFLKLVNQHMPTGKFALSGFRVFGKGGGEKPDTVQQLIVLRGEKDKRSAWIKWKPVDNAYAYTIYYGTAPDKLYNNILVYSDNNYWFKVMDREKPYYFSIEAVNENGISPRTAVIRVSREFCQLRKKYKIHALI